MTRQVQLTFFLTFILVIYGNVIPVTFNKNYLSDISKHLDNNNNVSPLVLVQADLNKLFDAYLPYLHKFILSNGLEPMQLLDYSDDLIKLLPGFLKGHIDLKNGWMQNFVKINRGEHITALYKDKKLTLDMDLTWDLMECQYEYYLKYLLYKRHGDLYSRFQSLNSKVIVTFDLAKYYMSFDSLQFTNVGKFELRFEGHLVDPVLNLVAKGITKIFKQRVLSNVVDVATTLFRKKFDQLNKMIPRPQRNTMLTRD